MDQVGIESVPYMGTIDCTYVLTCHSPEVRMYRAKIISWSAINKGAFQTVGIDYIENLKAFFMLHVTGKFIIWL